MAMGVLMKPRLLILNEPTTGLDSASTLQGLMRDAGRTIIASSHQLRCKEDQRVEQRELALRCIMESMCIAMYITELSNKMQRRDNAPQLFGLNLEPQ
ncbi:uncharacterized protein LOC110436929 isoform X2 [Sorghum bicolor]|uniref:uncharacterized protein LOC110436929 isoform X2 n=2 Tax=Sorghum bicolor TaxID=4558 RepID=UPI000B423F0F|nr:uncharacterized protein LOC110436929 isoform X2 [Sorghum bicolor]|eukprot:XP_021320337.1 uncharacterized protein LOC110436929 isoform X2 [Sorghum bicolor]